MERAVRLTTGFGKLALCYPTNFTFSKLSKAHCLKRVLGWLNLPKFLQIFLVTYQFLYTLDNAYNKSPYYQTGSHLLSDHVYFYLVYVGMIASDMLIRAAGIYFWKELPDFVASVAELLGDTLNFNMKKRGLTSHAVAAATLSLTFLCYGIALAAELDIFRPCMESPEVRHFLLTKNDFVIRSVFVIIDLMQYSSTAYALMFIVVYGETLLSMHGNCIDNFMQFVSDSNCPCRVGELTSGDLVLQSGHLCRKCTSCLANLKLRFIRLQQCFDDFEKIGGVYALAIVFQSTLITIRVVGVIAKIADKKAFNQTSFMEVQYVASLLALLLLAKLGTYLQSEA